MPEILLKYENYIWGAPEVSEDRLKSIYRDLSIENKKEIIPEEIIEIYNDYGITLTASYWDKLLLNDSFESEFLKKLFSDSGLFKRCYLNFNHNIFLKKYYFEDISLLAEYLYHEVHKYPKQERFIIFSNVLEEHFFYISKTNPFNNKVVNYETEDLIDLLHLDRSFTCNEDELSDEDRLFLKLKYDITF